MADAPHPFFPKMEYAFTIAIELTKATYIEPSGIGQTRAAVYAASGTVEGRINGIVVPMSGGDFPLVRADGVLDFDAKYLLRLDDGAHIMIHNRGYRWASPEVMERQRRNEEVGPDEYYMRASPRFDAPAGPHEWLNRHVFVGVAEKIPGANRIHYFQVL
ncbi:DUF3237 family protein [Sphingomonas baiyangensis]|uniref:UPF0311 protein FBR43_07655 n=1 Tax=Sphingomonas baiyangensis TaxID=2572576 RepID=A0A4V5PTM9_9SPHN|nr:DUF3237 family protein [Sphingomonas baiyangensis]TKD50658.1 DUF3237 family protein [Sphingomonas baiyangensis]